MIVLYGEMIIISIKPKIMVYVDNKTLVWLPVENNSCSSCIYHKITVMWYIIKLLYCNTSIYNVDSHTPYFDVFLWRTCSIPEVVINITTQTILSSMGDPYGIMIGKAPNSFLVTWAQKKNFFDIIKCLIWYFNFTIEWRFVSTFSLNYDVHVMKCLY